MNKNPDIIIIGSGIIGCSIAFELTKMGYQTLNLDRLSTSGAGPTANSCAIIRGHYSTRDGVAMAMESFKYWFNWGDYLEYEDEKGLAKYINSGALMIKSQGHNWRKTYGFYQELGFENEVWDLNTCQERIPYYDWHEFWPISRPEDPHFFEPPTRYLEGAIFTPAGGWVNDPQLSTHNLQRACEAKGAQFMFYVKVIDVRYDPMRVRGVTLEDGTEIDASVVINAAGAYSSHVNKMAGQYDRMNIKTKVSRHEVHHVPAPDGLDLAKDGIYTPDGDIACYYRPEVGNTFLLGSRDPDCDPFEIVDPDNYNDQITWDQWRAQVLRLAKRIPNLPIPNQPRGICDLYDLSDDWVPIYDKTDLPGYYVAIGTSGNQYKTAPVAGKMMAELIHKCESGHDHDANPLTFKLENIDYEMEVGFFSRNRELKNTSYSVAG
jgi:sarcosine oxidase subunit beta